MKTEAARAERIDRLSLSAAAAEKIRSVLEDTSIKANFDSIEAGLIEDLIKAETSDKRDTAAAEIRAFRKVRAALHALAFGGRHAEQKLAQLTKEVSNG